MAKQKRDHEANVPKVASPNFLAKHITEGGFIITLTLALFIFLSLMTYRVTDPGWTHMGQATSRIANAGGQVGAYIADASYWVFGYASYLLPIFMAYAAGIILMEHRTFRGVHKHALLVRSVGLLLLLIGGCGLLSLQVRSNALAGIRLSGGVAGQVVAMGLSRALNVQGALLLLFAALLVGVTWFTGLSWVRVVELIGFYTLLVVRGVIRSLAIVIPWIVAQCARLQKQGKEQLIKTREISHAIRTEKMKKEKAAPKLLPFINAVIEKPTSVPIKAPKEPTAIKSEMKSTKKANVIGLLPGLDLLDKGLPGKPMGGYSHQELESLSREVEQHLLDFGIHVDVVAVHPGPVITRFELQLAAGIKVSRLTALAKDLARSLSVTSVRVVEIIPGKTVVGIELPNPNRAMVCLSEVLSSEVYQQAHSPLTLALGVDIAGHPMVVDLAKMPHLLVAGTTGSGKSVGINAMILSLLFQATPEQVRLILIDPKMLELSVYDGIPHLLTPVVTDMKEASSALRWCVAEMERRYRLMAALGVRNLSGYNTMVTDAASNGEVIDDPIWKPTDSMDVQAPALQTLPYVVVVIDELADMMMVVGKKVEQLIARIAQKARAAGIHLILATQRPSVDVLTGLIKSNIPTRISFQVSSKIDSRTILDQQGAEQLLGHGDMLFLAPGTGAPLRVHGAFVDDKEVHRIADDWRARGAPDYIEEITRLTGDGLDGDMSDDRQVTEDSDPLYDQAVEFVIQTRKASVSSVQRRFKIGYNRAARLVEEMERTGLVGPLESGFREVLVASASED
ncbi:MAG: DNA translocase FtsK 4TM domain-containing protein [Legionellaceae bacterium]|nr:DNA translocase FtsK 4TM domain-containing protein [Legionellaceae bacterium]